MTPFRQRIAITEKLGTHHVEWTNDGKNVFLTDRNGREGEFVVDQFSSTYDVHFIHMPDYPNDLNAMHQAEKALTFDELSTYRSLLADSHAGPRGSGEWYEGYDCAIHATAAQRAAAFVKTIGKWQD